MIYAFTTYYNDHFAKKLNEERNFNIASACERINGTKVDPGASFSFNGLCWPYRKSNGYKKAPNISKEGYGYGGGVCQVSTTLYNCILGLPLQVDKWEVHRSTGVAYAPQHFDSAVGNYSDLAFTNLLPYQIIVEAYAQNGTLTTLIRAGEGAPGRGDAPAAETEPAKETGSATAEVTEQDTPQAELPSTAVTPYRRAVCDPDQGDVALMSEPGAGEQVQLLPCGIAVVVDQ